MADIVVLRAVFQAKYDQVADGAHEVNRIVKETVSQQLPDLVFKARVDRSDVDAFEKERKASEMGGGLVTGGTAGSSTPRTPRPSTQNPEKIAKTTAAAVEQTQRTSQARVTAIATEGEAKRAAIEQQGAQRRINAQAAADSRLENQERAHLQRLIQDKERAEQRLAMRPRMSMSQRAQKNSSIASSLNQAGNALTLGVTAPIVAGGALSLNEGVKFESSFADVKKTVDGTVFQLQRLKTEMRDMAAGKNAIPINVNELNEIAASAGELGIKTPMVKDFTKTMAMLGTTTNLSSEQASTSLARIDNILGTGQKSFDRYGSALVDLGNHGASTESEIVEMAQRLAGEAKQVGMSAPEVLGFSSALASVGVEAEAGGTAFSKAWKDIDKAVRTGGKGLDDVAKVAGVSASAFKKAWQSDASGATVSFVEGLAKIKEAGGSVSATLDNLGMKEIRQQDAIIRLAGAGSLLRDQLQIGERAWQQNSAMATEAGKRYETTASQLQILQNRLRELALKADDNILPGINKELKGFSDALPERAQKAAAAYEALGPAGQKAALGALAVAAAAGPTMKLTAGVFQLVSAYQKVRAAAEVAKAAGAVAGVGEAAAGAEGIAGVGGVAALASNPVGWIILAAAIVAAIGLMVKFKGDYDEVLARNKQLAVDTQQLESSFKRAFDLAPNSKLKNEIQQIGEKAQAADGNVNKLQTSLKQAQNLEIKIKKMDLDPASKDPLLQQARRAIAAIESQLSINVKISTENGIVEPGGTAPRDPVNVAADHEADLRTRAAKVGVAWPIAPKLKAGDTDLMDMMTYQENLKRYNAQLANIEKEVLGKEKAIHDARFDTRADAAIKNYSNNLAKLVEVQKAYSAAVAKGYKPDSNEVEGMGRLQSQINLTKAKVQDNHKAEADKANAAKARAKADAQAAADAKAAKQQKIDEAISDQKRSEVGRSLQQQLSDFNSFGSQVDGVLSSLSQTAEAGSEVNAKTAKSKMEAQLARKEFEGIPQPLKDAAVALAGIQAQLQKIVSTRDQVRGVFNGIFDGLGGGDRSQFAAFAQRFEGELKLSDQARALMAKAEGPASTLRSGIKNHTDALQSQIDLNQLAGRGAFDSSKNPNDGSMVSAARALVGQTGANAQVAGKAFGEEWCVGFVQTVRKDAGLSELANGTLSVKGLRSWAKSSGRTTSDPQAGDVFTIDDGRTRHAGIVSKRVGNTVTTIAGNEGAKNNFASRVKEGATYNINAPGVLFIRPEDTARTSKAGAPSTLHKSTSPGAADTDNLALAAFDGRLITSSSLSKSWGGSMNDYRAKPGESTQYRQQFEGMLMKMVADGTKISDKGIKMAASEGLRLDRSASIKSAGDEAARSIADMGRQIRLIGQENNPFSILQEEFAHGEKQFLSKYGKSAEMGMTLGLMSRQLQQGTKDAGRESSIAVRSANENNGMLGSNYNAGAYDRAQFATQKRFEIWDDPQIVARTQVVEKLKAEGKEHQALAIQKEVNKAATERLTAAMSAYDAQQVAGALKGHSDEMRRLTDEADMLKYVAALRAQTGMTPRERDDQIEGEKARRAAADRLAPHIATGKGAEYLRQISAGKLTDARAAGLAGQEGDQAKANKSDAETQSDKDALTSYNATIRDNIDLISQQRNLYALFGVDTPQLQTEIELLQERSRLLTGDYKDRIGRDESGGITVPADVENELKIRLTAKRDELDAQKNLNRLMDARKNADSEELAVLQMKKDAAMKLTESEAERLRIQYAYDDAVKLRNDPSYVVSDQEKAARSSRIDQTGQDDTQAATRRSADAAHDIFRDSISQGVSEGLGAGIKGLGERLKKAWMDAEIDKLARHASGEPADPEAASGSILGDLWNNRKKRGTPANIETPLGPLTGSGMIGAGPPLYTPFNPSARSVPSVVTNAINAAGVSGAAGQISGILGGQGNAMNALSIQITTGSANINSGVTNVNGGGLLGGMGKSGGGSGTAATVEQLLSVKRLGPGF